MSSAKVNFYSPKAAKLQALLSALLLCFSLCTSWLGSSAQAQNLGKVVFIGDSITQAGSGASTALYSQNGTRSYRWEVFKRLVDSGADFDFVGSLRTNYNTAAGLDDSTNSFYPTWRGRVFNRSHEGHYGWRAFQIAGDSSGDSSGRRGVGNITNWTDVKSGGYSADTAVIHIGINDITGSNNSVAQVQASVVKIITSLRSVNPKVQIHILPLLHLAQGHGSYVSGNTKVDAYNAALPAFAAANSTAESTVNIVAWNPPVKNDANIWVAQAGGWNPDDMTYDRVHPNSRGEALMGQQVALSLGAQSKWTAVSIENASFDGDATNVGTPTCAPVGWTIYGSANTSAVPRLVTDYSVINESTVDIATSGIGSSGKAYIIAGSADTGIKQTLTETLQPDRHYMLQVDVAKGSSALTAGDFGIEVWAGGTMLGAANNRVVPKLYATGTGSMIGSKLSEYVVEFTSRDFPALIGQPLEIRLISRNVARYIAFENVRLGWKNDPKPQSKHYKMYVLSGQSNSLGTTNGREIDKTAGVDLADVNIPFFWHNVPDATQSLGSSSNFFRPLQTQQGNYFYATSETHWGPEINFARSLYHAGERDFVMVKASRGGGGNANWDKASSGHMYTQVVDTVKAACDRLTKDGHTFEIKGLLYLQGESNSAAEAAIAGERFKTLIDNLRTELPNASALKGYMVGNADSSADDATTRQKQEEIAAANPSYLFYTDSLDVKNWLVPNDNLHHDKLAKLLNGARFADSVLGRFAYYDAKQARSGLFRTRYANSSGGTNGTNNTDTTFETGLSNNLPAASPILQGWFETKSAVPAPALDQFANMVSVNGVAAWQIKDDSTTGTGYLYSRRLSATQATQLQNDGWVLAQQLAFPEASGTAAGYVLTLVTPGKSWRVELGRDANGNIQALFNNGTQIVSQNVLANYQGETLKLKLVATAGSNTANLSINAQQVATISADTAASTLDNGAHFGTFSAENKASVNVFSTTLLANPQLSVDNNVWNCSAQAASSNIALSANLRWSASSSADWLSVTPGSGNASAQLELAVQANPNATSRTATISIYPEGHDDVAGVSITVNQAGIDPILSASSSSWSPAATASSTTIDITSNLAWTAASNAAWLTLSPAGATGNAGLSLQAAANDSTSQRNATVTLQAAGVADVVISVTQAAALPNLSVSSGSWNPSHNAASANFELSSNTNWSAGSSAGWLSVTPANGSGNATLSLSVSANTTTTPRSANVTLQAAGTADVVISVTQAAAPAVLAVSTNSWNTGSAAASTSVTVTSNLNWTAASNAAWLTLGSSSGSGSASLQLNAEQNTRAEVRSASVTLSASGVSSVVINVSQAAAAPILSASASSWNPAANAATTSINVTANLNWTASSNAAWLTLGSSAGSGSASLQLNAAQNTRAESRSATVTLSASGAGSVLINVTQAAAAPILSASASSWNPGSAAATTNIEVTANLNWTASSNAAWLTLGSSSGTGNAVLQLNAAQNSRAETRSATVTLSASGAGSVLINVTQQAAAATLAIDPSEWNAPALQASQNLSVTTNSNWSASSNAAWLSLSATSGSSSATISVQAQANSDTNPRSATVSFSAGDQTRQLQVTQAGSAVLQISSSQWNNIAADGASMNLQVQASGNWQVSSAPGWIQTSHNSGTAGTSTIQLQATANQGMQQRQGQLVISMGALSCTLEISQLEANSRLSVDKDEFVLSWEEQLAAVQLRASGAWNVYSNAPAWLGVDKSKGIGNATLNLKVSANNSSSSRSGIISIFCESAGRLLNLKVEQQGNKTAITEFSLSLASIQFKATPSSKNVVLKASSNWKLLGVLPSWLSLNSTQQSGTANLIVAAKNNPYQVARNAELVFECEGRQLSLAVEQLANPLSLALQVEGNDSAVNSLNRSQHAGSVTFKVLSASQWQAQSSAEWLRLSKLDDSTLRAEYDLNDSGKLRSATISVSNALHTLNCKFNQQALAAAELKPNPSSWKASAKAAIRIFKLGCNAAFSVQIPSGADWLKLVDSSAIDFKLSTSDNNGAARSAQVTLTLHHPDGDVQQQLLVNQAGKGDFIALQPANWTAAVEGESKSFVVVSNASWTHAVSKQDWLSISSASLQHQNGLLVLQAGANSSGKTRTATVTLSAGSKKATMKVTQEAYASQLQVTPQQDIVVDSQAATLQLQVSSNAKWKVTSSQKSWLTARGKASGTQSLPASDVLSVSIKANTSTTPRSAVLTIMAGAKRVDILVRQAGVAAPILSPASATLQAAPIDQPQTGTQGSGSDNGSAQQGALEDSGTVGAWQKLTMLELDASAQSLQLSRLPEGCSYRVEQESGSWLQVQDGLLQVEANATAGLRRGWLQVLDQQQQALLLIEVCQHDADAYRQLLLDWLHLN